MKKHIILLVFHICLLPKMLCGQESENADPNYKLSWLRLSIGVGGAGTAAGFDYNLSPVKGNKYYGVHLFSSSGFMDVAQIHTVAGKYGWHLNQKYGFAGASVGFGPVWGVTHGEISHQGSHGPVYEGRKFFTLGIPLEAELRFDPLRYLGAGFIVCANVNIVHPYIGMMMSLNIGKLKPHPNTNENSL